MIPLPPLLPRGWLLFAAGAAALLLAAFLGRRDVLTLAIFCFALPGVAWAALWLFKPGFSVKRRIHPGLARAGSAVSVVLEVRGHAPGGSRARLVEELPLSFHGSAVFSHPSPVAPHSPLSRYHYEVVPLRRGVFTVGPLRAEFSDPFGMAALTRGLDDGGHLTVAPAAVTLAAITLSDGRGQDGSRTIKELAHASQDDAMTREYRDGDPLRRVHWAVTARQGKLMVRAEESVTAPEATLLMDLRRHAFSEGPVLGNRSADTFEKAVTAVVSIADHLLERGYSVRVLDQAGRPGFATSDSALAPDMEDFSGPQGSYDIAAALAALEAADTRPGAGTPASAAASVPGSDAAGWGQAPAGAAAFGAEAFGDALAYKLHHGRRRGPLVAVAGLLSDGEARLLGAIAESTQSACALLLCQDPAEVAQALAILRRAGWQAAALTPRDQLDQTWLQLDRGIVSGLAP